MHNYTIVGLVLVLLSGCFAPQTPLQMQKTEFVTGECEVGVYGQTKPFITITKYEDAYDYEYSDGRRGAIRDGATVVCEKGAIRIDGKMIWAKRPLKITNAEFMSDGVTLVGQLLEPIDAGADTPLVVLAHGSEEYGWIESAFYPYQLVGRGISVFVYDKRGTGKSAGAYTQNFPQLADDLVMASGVAKQLAGERFGRFGLLGFSQGGWVVPLAAERSGAEFIGIGYGLVVGILEEDAAQVALELKEAGYGKDVLAKAKELTDVTARLVVSGYKDGLDDLDRLRNLYGAQAWFSHIKGGFTGVILGISSDELRENGIPMFDRLNIDWSIKPMNVLRKVNVPQLWALAEDDREAPISTTIDRLQTLRNGGKDITIIVFPNTDHGMREYKQLPDGTRTYGRVTDKYHDLMADWVKGKLAPPYAASKPR